MDNADYSIICDGGCHGNPGRMYGSYSIATGNGKSRTIRCQFGDGTNNQAEYLALISALTDITSTIMRAGMSPSGFTVSVRTDSQLVVNQINGDWTCRDSQLRQLRGKAVQALDRFKAHHIEWQPRAETVEALGH